MQFGFPRETVQIFALILGIGAFFGAARIVLPHPPTPSPQAERGRRPHPPAPSPLRGEGERNGAFLGVCALVAAALSAAYVALYLRGGPRIIDATSYFLEARALAEGHLAFRLDEPVASTLGRFLVRTDGADGSHAAVIFPPGYPALLALGFVLGHPLVIGPLLAAGITCTTWALARAVSPGETSSTPSIPRLAALFSVACAALRYHTADTMSHGLSALCFSGALVFALSAARAIHDHRSATWPSIAAGLFAGWLAATRPVSALALGITVAAVLASACRAHPRATLRLFASALLGSLPGIALLVAHQHAATGAFFASSQTAYYAVSDGPPDCFRYGFGAGIGCIGEHGEFVQRNLTHGYGAFAAAATTLRRLKQHLVDAGNSEPFTLVVLAGAVIAFRDPRLRFLPIGVLAQIAVYVPFYFDGNYPGGGARFYADVLPLEHVLAAIAVARFPPLSTVWRGGRGVRPSPPLHLWRGGRGVRPSPPLHLWRGGRGVRPSAVLALVPLGFAFRAGFDHAALRDRDGGRPMFEPSRLPNVEAPALLFVDTDHGFNLAFDPDKHGQASTSNSLTSNPWHVARLRGDALDLMTWQKHGKPAAYRYLFPLGVDHPDVRVVPYDIASSTTLGIEAENLWPPIAQDQGYALASWPNAPCASARRWLVVTSVSSDKPASITLALPAPFLAGRRIAARIGFEAAASASVSWVVDGQTVHSTRVSAADQSEREHSSSARCVTLPAFEVPEEARTLSIIVLRDAGLPADALVALDRIDIEEPKRR